MPTALVRLAARALLLALVLALAATGLEPLVSVAQEPPTAPAPIASPQPSRAASTPAPLPSHDWRAAGFVSLVGGRLYDPYCRPFRAVGSNVPNLLFREGLRENLEWMRQHQLRWLRVSATGHGSPRPVTQPGVDLVAR